MRTRVRATLLCVALLGALPALTAHAQPSTPQMNQAKAAAKVLADQGQAFFDEGRYADALDAFRGADQKFPAPTIKLMIARTHVRLGQLQRAREVYQQIVDEKLVHYAPQVFFDAQGEAKKELDALLPRLPTLTVHVTGAPPPNLVVTIDGQPARIREPLPQDPGEHTVTAAAPGSGRNPVTQIVRLQEGVAAHITLEMKAPPPPIPLSSFVRVEEDKPTGGTKAREGGGNGPVEIAAFGASGLALIVGAVSGVAAAGKMDKIEAECPDGKCFDGPGGDAHDSAQALATVSTVSFVAAGVLAAGGVVLLLWKEDASPQPVQAGLAVGPAWVGMRGKF